MCGPATKSPASLIVLDGARDVMATREPSFDHVVFDGAGGSQRIAGSGRMMMEARRRLDEDMSAASTERAEQLARDPKPTARPRRDEPGDLAWRAVDLDDALWIVDVMFAKGPKGILSLNGEEVTEANAKKVQSRLRRQRRQITGEIEAVGFGDVHGDYALRLPSEDKCGIAKGPKERLSRLQQPVAIVQKKNSVNLQGKGLKGCGVAAADVIILRPGNCDGATPVRMIGKLTEQGIEITFWDTSSGNHCFLGTLTRSSGPR